MSFSEDFLSEFDHEMATTRRLLERVPDGKADWKPHAKSTPLGKLATHVATLPRMGKVALETESLDMANPSSRPPALIELRDQRLAEFDKLVAEARAAIAGASEDQLRKTWTLRAGDRTIFSLPRNQVLRTMFLNHIIHHRAQLGVYLRLNDVPLPTTYGPSADENPFA